MRNRHSRLLSLLVFLCCFLSQQGARGGNIIDFINAKITDILVNNTTTITFSSEGMTISGTDIPYTDSPAFTFGVSRSAITNASGAGTTPLTSLTVPVQAPTIERVYPEPKVIGTATDPDPEPDPEPEVEKISISSATVTFLESSYVYTGKALTPYITVKNGSTVLEFAKDYTSAYSNNINAGTATVTITGIGNYTGTTTASFTIVAKDLSNAVVTLEQDKYTYEGSAVTPVSTVVCDGSTLKVGSDYEEAFAGNSQVGTASVTIQGKGNYSGTVSKQFVIVADPQVVINDSVITPRIAGAVSTYEYDAYGKIIATKTTFLDKWAHTTLLMQPAGNYVIAEEDVDVSEPIKYIESSITNNLYCQYDATSYEVTVRVTFREDPVITGIQSQLSETAEMRVYDYRGVLVLTATVGPDQDVTASMKQLPAGLYIVRINSESIKIQKK